MSELLILSVLFPAGIALVLACFPKGMPEWSVRLTGLLGFLVPAIASVVVFASYLSEGEGGFLYRRVIATGFEPFGIALRIGVNGVSVCLLLLAGIVGFAAGWAAAFSHAERKRCYLVLLLVMQSGLMGIFSTYDIFYLYFFHEFALIPSFIMIAIWGGSNRRPAAMEMTIYLTLGAMISLAGLIGIYAGSGLGSFDLISLGDYLSKQPIETTLANHLFGLLLLGLGILVSLFPFHSWAPRGYGAAPTSVSMLHAGVLKKFGLYTLIQVGLPLVGSGLFRWTDALTVLALGNVVIIGLITMAQRDLKQMIAYGSVMHMGYAFLGIATLSVVGVGGAVFMMLAHGLSVAALFNLATEVQHRTRSFDMREMGGLGREAPVLSALFMAAMMASVGLPGFASFWGELTIFVSLWKWNPIVMVIALSGIVITAIYGLRAISKVFFGVPSEAFRELRTRHLVKDLSWSGRVPPVLLILALLVFGLFPRLAGDPIARSLEGLWRTHPVLSMPHHKLELRGVDALLSEPSPDETPSSEEEPLPTQP